MSEQFMLQLIAYAVSIGAIYGGITVQIKQLQKRVDKHNNMIERTYKLEGRVSVLEEKEERLEKYYENEH